MFQIAGNYCAYCDFFLFNQLCLPHVAVRRETLHEKHYGANLIKSFQMENLQICLNALKIAFLGNEIDQNFRVNQAFIICLESDLGFYEFSIICRVIFIALAPASQR